MTSPSAPQAHRGSCLCGDVGFGFALPHVRFNYCHCSSCRKSTGSAHVANLLIPRAQFRWERGEERVTRFTDGVVNPGYQRSFCARCGGPVPRLNRTDEFMVVPAGLLDTPLTLLPERSLYWDERADWLVAVDAIPKFTQGLGSPESAEVLPARSGG